MRVATFPKNRVGLHVVELAVAAPKGQAKGQLVHVATRRFDLYNRPEASKDFADWVRQQEELSAPKRRS